MSRKLNLRKKRKGFTLIELILVIAIIGILGAIIVPKFTGVAEDATSKADLASARTIESAVNLAITNGEGQPDASIINQYLSNVTVTVDEENSEDDWRVNFTGTNDDIKFDIYKGGDPIIVDGKPFQDGNGDTK